jgi:hypothetical protein
MTRCTARPRHLLDSESELASEGVGLARHTTSESQQASDRLRAR